MILTVGKIVSEFDAVIGNMVPDIYNQIVLIISPALLLALTLAIALFGLRVMMGQIQNPREIYPLIWKLCITIVLIAGWGEITRLLYAVLSDTSMWIGGRLMDAVSGRFDISNYIPPIKGFDTLTIALTVALKLYESVANQIFSSGNWHNLTPYIYGSVTYLFGYGIVFLALLEILMAKFAIAFLFILVPIMSIFVAFGKTEKLFERHMGLIVGFSLQLFFVPAVVGFSLAFVKWSLIIGGAVNYVSGAVVDTTWSTITGFIICAFLGIVFVLKAAQWAQQIGSGFASGSGLGMMAAAVGGMMIGAKAAGKVIKPVGKRALHPVKTAKAFAGHPATQMAMKTAAFMHSTMGGMRNA